MPVEHYENFPVASWLLPPELRQPIEAIYAFARSADDFADEGSMPPSERLALLEGYREELRLIERQSTSDRPMFQTLGAVIRQHALPLQLFHDLLDAFCQDVTKNRYNNFSELMDYCRRSADPIGRLLLHLNRLATPQNLAWSDSICSSLQLINHWQDVAVDWKKNDVGRVYLPLDDLARFGLDERAIATGKNAPEWQQMMAFQTSRARAMMASGRPLGRVLPGRMGAELRTIMAGGTAILDKIDAVRGDVFRHRPQLTKWDWLRIGPKAALFG